MAAFQSIREGIPPINPAGRPFIIGTAVAAVAAGFLWQPLFWLLAGLALWMVVFFRDPVRTVPRDDRIVVAPADGRVEPIVEVTPPAELELGPGKRIRISVFMNVFDCHVNRAPVAGRVAHVAYKPGKFINADHEKASEDNERNGVVIEGVDGEAIGVVQIAGLVARRILCWSSVGDRLEAGERFGMIRFGSRVDVFLPLSSRPLVNANQRAIAGETVLAELRGANARPPYSTVRV